MTLYHGNGIFIDGRGVLLRGRSGSGKSDLALRLMALGAELIGDDYVTLARTEKNRVVMSAPENIAGRIEVRNVGIMTVSFRPKAALDLVVNLLERGEISTLDRLPDIKMITLEAVAIPGLDFYAFEASAPEKLRAALRILFQRG